MNKRLLSFLEKLISFLQKLYTKYGTVESNILERYHSLSPINNANGEQYYDALKWALRNCKKEDIKNVALTGPYGSGKSSILKTFQEKYKEEFSFLNISLATFKEELLSDTEDNLNKQKPQDKDLLRLIELSILQQIFYHEEDRKIPDSRFKKIKSFRKSNLILIASSIVLLLICGFNLFAPEKFKEIFHLKLSENADLFLHITSLGLVLAGIYIMLLRSIRLLNSIKISKFKFQDTEIEIDKTISKSILNNHLDEILYFFEVTSYTVVIIEDLDRFQQTEIFTKLRELNLLINNSKKVKRDIVFLYAVRDDMFRDKDRTKFFDFIVPIIPVINSSNSNEKLLEIIRENSYNISDDLIDDISLFIDDMRLLYNITNEYHIYHEKLDQTLNQNKLLGIVVYKNIHPNDFVNLSNGTGILYNALNTKGEFIKNALKAIDNTINALKSEIAEIEEIQIKNIKELRKLYVLEYLNKIGSVIAFNANGTEYNFIDVLEDSVFDYFKKDKMKYKYLMHNYSGYYSAQLETVPQQFSEIEKSVDSKTYDQREKLIKSFSINKAETIKQKIANLEKEKTITRHHKLKDIIAAGNNKIELPNEKQNLLVNILLRNGYIDEDYLDYISIFYEGSITKEDRLFLLNLKSQIALDFDFKLKKMDKLIGKIGALEFEKDYILNFNLLDYLLTTPGDHTKLSSILDILKNESTLSVSFINGFIESGTNVSIFIKQLVKKWPAFWKFIDARSAFTQERKLEYFKLLIAHAETSDIVQLSFKSDLSSFISNRSDFLVIIEDSEKLKQIISALNIKFKHLDLSGAPVSLLDFIYEGDFYELSEEMIRNMLKAKGTYNEADFVTQNYSVILNSNLEQLTTYISKNIDSYITDVYLEINSNIEDPQGILIDLLNNAEISIENKEQIIERSSIKIDDLGDIGEIDIDTILLKHSKVIPDWENLISYYSNNDRELDDAVISYMNNDENANALALTKINKNVTGDRLTSVNKFIQSLVVNNKLTDGAHGKLMRSVPYSYKTIEFEGLSGAKVYHLINNYILSLSPDNFNYLKEHFPGTQIALLVRKPADFVKRITEFELDEADHVTILDSGALNANEKLIVYSNMSIEQIQASGALSQSIGCLLLDNTSWNVDKSLLKHILTKHLSVSQRVQLFNIRFRLFDKSDVTDILHSWIYPYSDIAVNGKRPLLDNNQGNLFFANNLKTLGYISKFDTEKNGIRISTFRK